MKQSVDDFLNECRERIERQLESSLPSSQNDSPLNAALRYTTLDQGKRIRPCLAYAMSKPINGESTILKLDTSGTMTQLSVNGISRFMATADNKLVISKANKKGLFLINQDGSNEEVLLKDFPAASLNHWSSTQTHVYYRDTYTDDQQTVLATWKINIDTRLRTKVSLSFANCVGPSMSISTDQNRILLTKTDRAESDIFMTILD